MSEAVTRPMEPGEWSPPLVLLVGMGMGPEDLSVAARRWIDRAEVLLGGNRHLESLPAHPGRRVPLGKSLEESLAELEAVSRLSRTAVLASGDPLFFGIGRRLIGFLGKDRVKVIPGVTTVQALCARLGLPWDGLEVFSLHGRGEDETPWLSAARLGRAAALYTDRRHSPAWIARRLVDEGLPHHRLLVGEDLGLATERVRELTPREALDGRFSALNLCLVLPGAGPGPEAPGPLMGPAPDDEPVLGIQESALAHQAGLITKLEIRAAVLAHLRLRAGLVLWDIGAGSGSVSIEASRVAPLRQVFALEKNVDRYRQLLINARRFGRGSVEALWGSAAELIPGLPDPDRVFIGGSGGDLGSILQHVAARLRPGGRVVQTAVTLDTFQEGRAFWLARGWKVEVAQLQVNRSVPIGGSVRFEALNPVFLVTAAPPDDPPRKERS
ncbi:MAG: precorrin-6y C5,15-methyltransferase (decarboxylating) subunit CbiE [Syntrophobacteraceae bacterium]|nr:precorrin-6y C5,15-methyltransferase (decarboxylating) subunit CbiE [Syntrophobacteraceae bacterium]